MHRHYKINAIVTDHDIMDQIDYYTGMDILAKEDGPFPLPESCKTPELEAWRKKWIKLSYLSSPL